MTMISKVNPKQKKSLPVRGKPKKQKEIIFPCFPTAVPTASGSKGWNIFRLSPEFYQDTPSDKLKHYKRSVL